MRLVEDYKKEIENRPEIIIMNDQWGIEVSMDCILNSIGFAVAIFSLCLVCALIGK